MTPHPLKVERELRGWSQAKVAKILGTTTRTIGRWEQGQAVPYPHYREQLCALFGKDALELGISMKSDNNKSTTESHTLVKTSTTTPDEQVAAGSTCLLDPAIPQLPGQTGDLLGRDGLLLQAKQSLLGGNRCPAIAFHGLPGVGKTALAIALAMDQQIQARFCDGILWGSLGPHANALDQLMRWGALLGVSPNEVKNVHSCASWRRVLRMRIGTRRLLLIIDDAWSADDALVLQVGGAFCAHILTTRQPQAAFAFAQEGVILIPELAETDALALLARFVPLLAQHPSEEVLTLVRAVGGIPLALTLMGKYLARQAFTGQPRRLQSAITRLQAVEHRFHMSTPIALTESASGHPGSVPISLSTTIASSEQRLSSSARAALCALALFPPKPASFSESAAIAISQQPVEALDELWDAGLLESCEPGRYTLHQVISDFARLLYDDTEARKRLVRYALSLLEANHSDYAALRPEVATIVAALDAAITLEMYLEVIQATLAFVPFMRVHGLYSQAHYYLDQALQVSVELADIPDQMIIRQHLHALTDLGGDQQQIEVSTPSCPFSSSLLPSPLLANEKRESALSTGNNCKDTS